MDARERYEQRIESYSLEDCLDWLRGFHNQRGCFPDTKEPIVNEIAEKTARLLEELKCRQTFIINQKKNRQAQNALDTLFEEVENGICSNMRVDDYTGLV